MRNLGWIITLGGGALFTLILSGLGQDGLFRTHMAIIAITLGIGAVILMRRPDNATVPAGIAEAEDRKSVV